MTFGEVLKVLRAMHEDTDVYDIPGTPSAMDSHEVRHAAPLQTTTLLVHARPTMGMRTTLLTTERLFWHCRDHTALLESAPIPN